ncbi:hypothetical protein BUALT_Bualt17G0027200 [Buddleja alternifolia]|uniref:Helix-turn-helix DNA-binding domain-containing protein n=1 Tax=Buddleja alternifolia TaxID=168488 RepID=A0AAV6W5U9_9LAMI|nr:hypothetical protein BUALT_Bualt17G0027200 [Buddleja alternifolia]
MTGKFFLFDDEGEHVFSDNEGKYAFSDDEDEIEVDQHDDRDDEDDGCSAWQNESTNVVSTEMEREWIYNLLVGSLRPLFNKSGASSEDVDELKSHIARFLELMHVQKLDVPFISMYRREEISSLLKDPNEPEANSEHDQNQKPMLKWHKVLWLIHELDQRWLLLQKRKSELQSHYNKVFEEETRRVLNETRLSLYTQLSDSITKSLKEANSEREVDDVDSKFKLHFAPGEVVDEGQYEMHARCSKAGLWKVASKFLEKMWMAELEDAKKTPEALASTFTSAKFKTPQDVLKEARHMAAIEINCEPCVRKQVRSSFMDNAVVSINPISDGSVATDSFHQSAGVKWLSKKPLTSFEDAEWLLIQKAEEEKLLQVTLELPETVLDKLTSELNVYFLSDGVSESAQLWNDQRRMILHDALNNLLLPSMKKETRS